MFQLPRTPALLAGDLSQDWGGELETVNPEGVPSATENEKLATDGLDCVGQQRNVHGGASESGAESTVVSLTVPAYVHAACQLNPSVPTPRYRHQPEEQCLKHHKSPQQRANSES